MKDPFYVLRFCLVFVPPTGGLMTVFFEELLFHPVRDQAAL